MRQIPKPPSADAQHVYEATEFRPESAEEARRGSMLAREAPEQYQWATQHRGAIPAGTVFDVGAGTGALLDEFKARGWQTFGIEPTPHFAAYAAANGHALPDGCFLPRTRARRPHSRLPVWTRSATPSELCGPLAV